MEEFSCWIEDRKESYKDFLVPDLKVAAFKLLIKQRSLLMKVSVVYNFIEHKDIFLQLIEVCY